MTKREFKKIAKVWNATFDEETIETIVEKVVDENIRGLYKYAKMIGLEKGRDLFDFVENTRYVGWGDVVVKGLEH